MGDKEVGVGVGNGEKRFKKACKKLHRFLFHELLPNYHIFQNVHPLFVNTTSFYDERSIAILKCRMLEN